MKSKKKAQQLPPCPDEAGPLTARPFAGLGALVSKARRLALTRPGSARAATDPDPGRSNDRLREENEGRDLFLRAVADVVPLHRDLLWERAAVPSEPKLRQSPEDTAPVIEALQALVEGRALLPVKDTPEFVQGEAREARPFLSQRLHQGAFAIQAYCDLHGYDLVTALDVCAEFLLDAMTSEKRCVAVIHGRGLSSPKAPVLKEAVTKWLTRGPYRRHVMAFASAPPWDGGAGVTYVYLRKRPAKRQRRANRWRPC